MEGAIVAVVIGAIGIIVVATVVGRATWDRRQRTRLAGVLERLGVDDVDASASSEDLLARLERSVRRVVDERAAIDVDLARLRAAFDGIPHSILLFDTEGRILDANATAAPVVQARHGDALVGAAIVELVATAIATGEGATSVELFGPPRRIVEVSAVRLPGGSGVVATVEDITERRHLEEVRTDLVANISHELKTPVGAIGLLAETIEDEVDPAVISRLAGRIGAEAIRLAAIVDDLLDLSRVEAATGLDDTTVALDEVVVDATERLRSAADRAGVALVMGSSDRDAIVVGDRSQLVSAVANLVDNAIKYSDRGTVVEVSVGADAEGASIAVSDRGMGIPTRDIDRIFERFYRVDQARSRDTGGSGLGLSIVRNVARNHGGRVEVRSRLGEGSTFTIVLPVDRAVTAATREDDER